MTCSQSRGVAIQGQSYKCDGVSLSMKIASAPLLSLSSMYFDWPLATPLSFNGEVPENVPVESRRLSFFFECTRVKLQKRGGRAHLRWYQAKTEWAEAKSAITKHERRMKMAVKWRVLCEFRCVATSCYRDALLLLSLLFILKMIS